MSGDLLSLAEAQQRLLALAPPAAVERIGIEEASGRILAEDLVALRTQPERPLSAMDGWAIRGEDLSGPWPGPWRIVGESAAGHPFAGTVGAGEAARISTGAIVPDGADAVLVQEDCRRDGDALLLEGQPPKPAGRHIRRRGLDFAAGDRVLAAGTPIGPAQLALAIAAGHARIAVGGRPLVAVVDCGDELARPGEPLAPGAIPASNGPMLAAMLGAAGCEVRRIGPIGDDRAALRRAFADCADCAIVVTSGGVSVGDHDLVRPALENIGARLDFWRVAIKPGKPIMVAHRAGQLILGLPGNPVSSFVTAFLFALPLARAAQGARDCLPATEPAIAADALPPTGKRAEFLRGRLADGRVALAAVQDSSALGALVGSNVLIVRAPMAEPVAPGEQVPVHRIGFA